ncbi:MAG: FAD:protein transferase [Solirubrobacteraceae bacterium]|nr:FAD:protein transferase [Solirubrobacteraceae bacterium]
MSVATATSTWHALGTTAGIVVLGDGAHDAARREVEAQLAQIDAACSRFRDDSELTAVNAARGRPVRVSSTFLDALEVALRAAAVTDGRVDPTVGAALVVAGYDRDFARVRGSRVRRLRAGRVPGWRVVWLDRDAGTVRVPPGVTLDLGATAKALAADRAAERALRRSSATGVLVNLGGDIATAGVPPPGGWRVRVADSHRAEATGPGQAVTIASGGLSTSSTTVRRWRRRGADAHHILDPGTGAPAAEHWRTVSVAAASCVDANIASTAAIVLGAPARAWLRDAGLPARLVTVGGEVAVAGGWPADVEMAGGWPAEVEVAGGWPAAVEVAGGWPAAVEVAR